MLLQLLHTHASRVPAGTSHSVGNRSFPARSRQRPRCPSGWLVSCVAFEWLNSLLKKPSTQEARASKPALCGAGVDPRHTLPSELVFQYGAIAIWLFLPGRSLARSARTASPRRPSIENTRAGCGQVFPLSVLP